MKLDLKAIEAEIELGNVNVQTHPNLNLKIAKYSQQSVFSRHWNDITKMCRGLVYDEEGNVVVYCMGKFYNHSEADGIPVYEKGKLGPYTIYNKMDGSLIQVAKWKGNLIVTSSGSFQSTQAVKATELIQPFVDKIKEGRTYIFEYIAPSNRIVIDYGDKVSLTLLAVRDTGTGEEYDISLEDDSFEKVESVDKTLEEVEAELSIAEYINKEGYIALFVDGSRVKLKYDRYCELHKVISGLNELSVWENLSNNVDVEKIITNIPDELYDWLKTTVADLKSKFVAIEYKAVELNRSVSTFNNRKEQADWLLKNHKDMASIVFCMLDGKDYSDKIWKQIRPIYSESKKFGRGES